MKQVKKLLTLVLAVMLVLTMAAPALASESTQTYTITVKNGYKGETYTAYKIFDVKYIGDTPAAGATDNRSYAYTITNTSAWFSDIVGSTQADANGDYILPTYGIKFQKTSVSSKYNVVDADTNNQPSTEKMALLAVELAKHTSGKISAGTGKVDLGTGELHGVTTDVTINLSPDEPGYYFVTTTTGALCALNTTNPNAEVEEKNNLPSVDKKQTKTKNGDDYTNYVDTDLDVKIGDTVSYQITVTDGKGTDKVIKITDTMSAGLTYKTDSIKIQKDNTDVTTGNYTLSISGQTITIEFTADYVKTLDTSNTVVITYEATVNEKAVTKSEETDDNKNENKVTLTYSAQTQEDEVFLHTYKFQLVKTDNANNVLSGAKFQLYTAETDGDPIGLIATTTDGITTYRPLKDGESTTSTGYTTKIDAGKPVFRGFAHGDYYFEETVAPDGYNILTGRTKISISDAGDMMATFDNSTPAKYDQGGLQIENNTGSVLPTTGGMGTTIFYILGGILVVGAGLILITRRRMNGGE